MGHSKPERAGFVFPMQTQLERRTGERKPCTIGNSVVKLYSIDGGKIWFSRPSDLQLFKQRRNHHVKIVKKLVCVHVKN